MLTDIEKQISIERRNIRQEFGYLLQNKSTQDVQSFISNKLSLELINYNDGYLYKIEDNSIFTSLIEHNAFDIIDYVINLPKFKSDPKYDEYLVDFIEIGFKKACEKNDVFKMAYYEKLQKAEFVESGLQAVTCEKENGKLTKHHNYLKDCLSQIIENNSSDNAALNFILSLKNKYKPENSDFCINYFIDNFLNDELNKAEFILDQMQMSYDTELFAQVFHNIKNKKNHPLLTYLVVEKNIEYNDDIKKLIENDSYTKTLFLNRELENKLTDNKMGLKKIKI